jgi:regulator of sirC expression with transglutaminase-like and TPR domain
MLRNLKEVHRTQHDWQRLITVLDRLIVLLPDAWGERRDRGLAHAERGNTLEAMADLEAYLAHAEDGLDIDLVADRLSALRNANG